jgi:hypothetical protein
VQDGNELIQDNEGVELPNIEAVKEECRRIIESVLDEPEFRDQRAPGRSLRITDESGRPVLIMPFE